MAELVTIDRVRALSDALQGLLTQTDGIQDYNGAYERFQNAKKLLQPVLDDLNLNHPGQTNLVSLSTPLYECIHEFAQGRWLALVNLNPKTQPNYNAIAEGTQTCWRQMADLFDDMCGAYVVFAQTA